MSSYAVHLSCFVISEGIFETAVVGVTNKFEMPQLSSNIEKFYSFPDDLANRLGSPFFLNIP